MAAINKVLLMGRLTADPELRQTPNGVSNCQITVAVDRNYSSNGEKQTDFITVVAWRQTAEFICKYFSKGKMIIVEGALRTRSYDDKRYPDVKHYVMEVYADNVQFGESKSAQNANTQQSAQQQKPVQNSPPQPQAQQMVNANTQQFTPMQGAQIDLNGFEEVNSGDDLPF